MKRIFLLSIGLALLSSGLAEDKKPAPDKNPPADKKPAAKDKAKAPDAAPDAAPKEEAPPAAVADRGKTIWLITRGTRESNWRAMFNSARKAGKDLGVKIKWQAPMIETDAMSEPKLLQMAIAANADGIILAPMKETALSDGISKALSANIPLVIVDSPLNAKGALAMLATDYALGGALAAKRMGKILDGNGKIILLKNHADNPVTGARERGFKETLAKEFPNIKIVAEEFGKGERESSEQICTQLLGRASDAKGLFASSEASTYGALAAVSSTGRIGSIKIIGSDGAEKIVEEVNRGMLDSALQNNPAKMAYDAVKAICDHWDNKTVDAHPEISTELVIKKDAGPAADAPPAADQSIDSK